MATLSLGKVTVSSPGNPVQATINQPRPADRYPVNGYMCQSLPTNTGLVYIGLKNMNKATLVGVLGILPVPTPNAMSVPLVLPTFSASAGAVPVVDDMTFIYVDADIAGNGCIISAVSL